MQPSTSDNGQSAKPETQRKAEEAKAHAKDKGDQVKQATQQKSEDAKSYAKDKGEQAKLLAQEKADELKEQAQARANDYASSAKDQVSHRVGAVASAVHSAGHQLESHDEAFLGDYVHGAASEVERVERYFHDRDPGQILNDLENFARRNPAVFVSGAMLAGLATARFFRSSASDGDHGDHSDHSDSDIAGQRSNAVPRPVSSPPLHARDVGKATDQVGAPIVEDPKQQEAKHDSTAQ